MALITLSGVIRSADLNNNFEDKISAIDTVNEEPGIRDVYYNFNCKALATTSTQDVTTLDFTASDFLQVITLGLSIWNPDATSRTALLTLSGIDVLGNALTTFLPNPPSVSVTGAAAAEFNAVRTNIGAQAIPMFLVKGLAYRLTLARTDANAGVITNAQAVLVARSFRRYL